MKKYAILLSGVVFASLVFAAYLVVQNFTARPVPVNPVLAGDGPSVVLMDFSTPFSLTPPPEGWWKRKFFNQTAMKLAFAEQSGVKALRCETSGSGSIFGRFTDVDIAAFPMLSWNWLVAQPVVSNISETDKKGDDHPARLLLKFRDTQANSQVMEIIWSNGALKPGQWKIIEDFPHYVANGGNAASGENTNKWFNEKINLLDIYHTAFKRTDTPRLMSIAIFCDTDDTDAKSVAYFGKVTLGK